MSGPVSTCPLWSEICLLKRYVTVYVSGNSYEYRTILSSSLHKQHRSTEVALVGSLMVGWLVCLVWRWQRHLCASAFVGMCALIRTIICHVFRQPVSCFGRKVSEPCLGICHLHQCLSSLKKKKKSVFVRASFISLYVIGMLRNRPSFGVHLLSFSSCVSSYSFPNSLLRLVYHRITVSGSPWECVSLRSWGRVCWICLHF